MEVMGNSSSIALQYNGRLMRVKDGEEEDDGNYNEEKEMVGSGEMRKHHFLKISTTHVCTWLRSNRNTKILALT